jgi:hypothetical protein
VQDLDVDPCFVEVAPELVDAPLHLHGGRRVVLPHVRRGRDRRDPVGGGAACQLARVFQRARSVVEPGEDVRVKVDQGPDDTFAPCDPPSRKRSRARR